MRDSTSMMDQYRAIKSKYKDAILFFRLGDFYEMFYEDAEIGSRELGIALTKREAGQGKSAPMCGVPYHSVDDYIKIFIQKGYKIAICEQMEDPSLAKGLVKREVVRLITPGTYWEGAEKEWGSYIVSISPNFSLGDNEDLVSIGFCAADLSEGEVLVEDFRKGSSLDWFFQEIERIDPRECIYDQSIEDTKFLKGLKKALATTFFTPVYLSGKKELEGDFQSPCQGPIYSVYGQRAEDICLNLSPETVKALSQLLDYLRNTQMKDPKHLREPVSYFRETICKIDQPTRRNLEITKRLSGDTYGSLAWVMDKCCTSMGSRLLRKWLDEPLAKANMIRDRLSAVDELFSDSILRQNLEKSLSQAKDIERLATRLSYGTANARDLVAIAGTLKEIPKIKEFMVYVTSPLLIRIRNALDGLSNITGLIEDAFVDNPPLGVQEGYIIRDGFSKEVDSLRDLAFGGKKWVLEFEAKERERTGIKNLKVGYNRVFGYYVEITKSNLDTVPKDYIRKQTLSTCERFSTDELKEKESLILGAEERLFREEYNLFCEIRDEVSQGVKEIQEQGRLLAQLDVLSDFARVASLNGYVKPQVSDEGPITIEEGRHPVLEQILPPGQFVPNNLSLSQDRRVLIITGPNMGGKSTYIREAALIILMAQAGSFVPAKSCSVCCVDRIFARVGAYDDLVLGQSTFMVEMSEIARILSTMGKRSLIILDELGRGTSTFDGMALAWAVVEHLSDLGSSVTFTLVATHYRELTVLSDLKPGIVNLHVAVKRKENEVVFLRKVIPGVAQSSFGIEVAKMAGLPGPLIDRAKEVLLGLEQEARRGSRWQKGILGQAAQRSIESLFGRAPDGQMTLFNSNDEAPSLSSKGLEIIREIMELDPDSLSPRKALEVLYSVKKRLDDQE